MKSKVPSLAELVGSVVGEHGSLETIVSVLAFIGVTPKTLNLLSTHFVKFLTDKSVSELRELLGASGAADMSAPTESIFMLHGDQKPFKVTITIQEQEYPVDGATLVSVLSKADVQTLCTLKGVNESWKAVARRVLCERLYTPPVPNRFEEAQEINIEPFLTQNGLGVEHLGEAVTQLEYLETMVTSNFVVDVRLMKNVETIVFSVDTWWEDNYDVLAPVRRCISPSDSSPPASLLLAVYAACYQSPIVPAGAWYHNATLESIVIPAGFTAINQHAFSGCSNLSSVTLPATVTHIFGGFDQCTSLMDINLPASITYIGVEAFALCQALTEIVLPPFLTFFGSGAFARCSGLTKVVLPTTLTSIPPFTFFECSALTDIELPASLTSIGDRTFHLCSALTTINLPASLTFIDRYAFARCSGLTEIDLPTSLRSISAGTFSSCSALTKIHLPANLRIIGENAFQNCSLLEEVTLSESLTLIKENAFEMCRSLRKVEFPVTFDPLTPLHIEAFAFTACTSLKSISLPYGATFHNFAFGDNVQISHMPLRSLFQVIRFVIRRLLSYIIQSVRRLS